MQTTRVILKRERGLNTILGRSKRKFRELEKLLSSPKETRKTVPFCRRVFSTINAAHEK